MMTVVWIYLGCMGLLLLAMMGIDKSAAILGKRRIPERTLLSVAALGGAAGGIIGMLLFRHKIRKPAFFIGYPLFLLVHTGLVYIILRAD